LHAHNPQLPVAAQVLIEVFDMSSSWAPYML